MALKTPTFTPQPYSRLLALAGELKNRIYRLALVDTSNVLVKTEKAVSASGRPIELLALNGRLLLVCKQIRHEASEIFYLENNFTLTEFALRPAPLVAFTQACRSFLRNITSLTISHELLPYPMSCQRACFQVNLHIFMTDGAVTVDGSKPLIEEKLGLLFGKNPRVCSCEIDGLALYNSAGNVLEWAEMYLELLESRKDGPHPSDMAIWCWDCTGINAW